MRFLNFLQKLKITDYIIIFIFIILSILSIIILKLWSILTIIIMILLLVIYYNIDKIIKIISKKRRKKKKKEKKIDNIDDDIATNINESKEVDSVKKVNVKEKKKVNSKVKIKAGKEKEKEKRKLWKKILTIILMLGIILVLMIAAFMAYIAISAGTFDPDALANSDQTVVYDKDNNVIATLGLERRESVTYDELPQVLVDAIIATEDSRFFQHNGVDFARFIKASFGQILGHSDAGGASTLTMQISKNNLTNTNNSGIKGIIRKFQDVYIAVFQIEKKYTKQEIIEYYVNDNYLGSNVYGVGQASEYYFGKKVSELSLPEAALLAGMFQAPTTYNPYKNPEKATERRATVLNLMVRHGYITKEEADMAGSVDVSSMLVGIGEETDYQGYIDTVAQEIIDLTGNDPYTVAMKVYTNMDKHVQDGINAVLSGEAYSGWENDVVQAGIAVTDVNTGGIIAVGAGRNRSGEKVFNYATDAKRQPGSTAKPIFDYGPGFEYNNFSTYTLFNDEPWAYTNGPSVGNWDGSYYGLITLRQALSVSRNVPALKAFQQVSKSNILKFIKGLGLDPNLEDGVLHEAYAIGGGDGFTPLEMAIAYAAFANGGYYIEAHAVNKIEYRDTGEVVEFTYDKERVIQESTAYLINNVLQYAVDYGFNGGAKVYGSTVAAKTGTSNLDSATIEKYGLPSGAVNDLWTCAYTPEYSIALWYGYEEITSDYYLSGASAPKDSVMRAVMQYIPTTTKEFTMPSTVVASQVEFGTWPAQLPSAYTPSDFIRTEYFIKGTEPTEVSERFAKFSSVTNLKSTSTTSGTKLTWNYTTPEVLTESYLNKYFSQSVFGNGTSGFVQERLNYNSSTLGGFGFGIYTKSDSGTLTQVGFTTKNEYTYTSKTSGNVTLVVKAEYEKFKANASDGVEIKFTNTASSNDDTTSITGKGLEANIGNTNISITSGNYSNYSITVTYDGNDVTSDATIIYEIGDIQTSSSTQLENYINTLEAGTYKLKYTITYNGEVIKKDKTIKIK